MIFPLVSESISTSCDPWNPPGSNVVYNLTFTVNATINVSKLTSCVDDGWTVIQARGQFGNPTDFFWKTYQEYEEGFGEAGNKEVKPERFKTCQRPLSYYKFH